MGELRSAADWAGGNVGEILGAAIMLQQQQKKKEGRKKKITKKSP